jgi:hypothetical protein
LNKSDRQVFWIYVFLIKANQKNTVGPAFLFHLFMVYLDIVVGFVIRMGWFLWVNYQRERPLNRIYIFFLIFPKPIGKLQFCKDRVVIQEDVFLSMARIEIEVGRCCHISLWKGLPNSIFQLDYCIPHQQIEG